MSPPRGRPAAMANHLAELEASVLQQIGRCLASADVAALRACSALPAALPTPVTHSILTWSLKAGEPS